MLSREQIRRFFSRRHQFVERSWDWGYAGLIFRPHTWALGFTVRSDLGMRRFTQRRWVSAELNLGLVKLYGGVNGPAVREGREPPHDGEGMETKAQRAARKAR